MESVLGQVKEKLVLENKRRGSGGMVLRRGGREE